MNRSQEAGISLLEIMITVAIVAVLAAIAIPNIMAAKLASNETAAIASLRSIVSAQAQLQGLVAIDADNDAIGEYGTFAEMSGATGVRRRRIPARGNRAEGVNFNDVGKFIEPPLLPGDFAEINDDGWAVKSGYAFMIFLPDTSRVVKWTHEIVRTRTRGRGKRKRTVILPRMKGEDGGRGVIGIDWSEMMWCAYAQPAQRESSGNRAFFTNQQGDVLQSMNENAKHEGYTTAISPRSAYLGRGITSKVATGTMGYDGDVWKITN
ncbi:MAG: prepilin-type N-terminal cleavage/methylation domain-containing protein [Planctomycetota bacterium]|jgi:hypothetical protein